MKPTALLCLWGLMLSGCALSGDGGNAALGPGVNGEAAYLEHCAGCHETGILGAPREGAPQDWQTRSSLWQAVLMEHAREGFFEMPARGGKTDLPDEVVDAAAEYMLEMTFPDRPRD